MRDLAPELPRGVNSKRQMEVDETDKIGLMNTQVVIDNGGGFIGNFFSYFENNSEIEFDNTHKRSIM
jgi:hypothetical protein